MINDKGEPAKVTIGDKSYPLPGYTETVEQNCVNEYGQDGCVLIERHVLRIVTQVYHPPKKDVQSSTPESQAAIVEATKEPDA